MADTTIEPFLPCLVLPWALLPQHNNIIAIKVLNMKPNLIAVALMVIASSALWRPAQAQVPADAIVLLSVKPQDPFSPRVLGAGYVQQVLTEAEARRYMPSHWKSVAPVHRVEAGQFLASKMMPLITRNNQVESTLAAYRTMGGQMSAVRIDVLSANPEPSQSVAQSPVRKQAARAGEVPALVKKYQCASCHQVDRKLIGSSFRDIAGKYRSGPAPEETLYEFLTSGAPKKGMAGLGGHHVPKNEEVRSLVRWVLAQ